MTIVFYNDEHPMIACTLISFYMANILTEVIHLYTARGN